VNDILDDAPTDVWTRPEVEPPRRRPPRHAPGADDLWDVHRAASFLSMSKHWVYKAVAGGAIPYRRIGSAIRFIPAELRAWANRRAMGG
jgi:excisionase family DNA binding protein